MFDDGSSLSQPLITNSHKISGEKIEEAEANSYDHTKATNSFSKTCFHTLNALSGVGLLSTPYALAAGGWSSLILFFLIASVTFYSALLIRKCMDMDSTIRTYPDIGHRSFGHIGRLIVTVFMYLELYLVATGFLILEGDNLKNLFPDVCVEILMLRIGSREIFVILVTLIVLPSVWLDNLSILSYVSATGALASAVIVGCIFWVGAFDGIGFEHEGVTLNFNGLSTAVSLYAFCYCAHPVFPTLYTSMKNKRQFSNVLLVCFMLCTLTYASMAVLGYMMFGSTVQSQITLNLPKHTLSSQIAIYTTLVNPIAKYALMVTPIINAIKISFPTRSNKRLVTFLVSTSLVTSTAIVALSVPFFAYLMSLIGALFSATASIILPCLCYAKMSGNYRRFGFETVVQIGVVLMGVVIIFTGTYTAVLEIVCHL